MAILQIRVLGDPVLRERSVPVTRFDADLARLGEDLLETMRAAPGVGLAAPQVGMLRRVFAFDIGDGRRDADADATSTAQLPSRADGEHDDADDDDDESGRLLGPSAVGDSRVVASNVRAGVAVNPVIVEADGEQFGDEGCLSVPGVTAQCLRWLRVRMQARDVAGRPLDIEAVGLLARVFQHEIDHLDGVLFLDRLERGERKLAMRMWRERERDLEPAGVRPHLHRFDLGFRTRST